MDNQSIEVLACTFACLVGTPTVILLYLALRLTGKLTSCGECLGGELQDKQWGPCPTCAGDEAVGGKATHGGRHAYGRNVAPKTWQAKELRPNYRRKK